MTHKKEIIAYAVSMILKSALLAAAWAGKSRKRGLESIAIMPIDEKDKELLFLRDRMSLSCDNGTSYPGYVYTALAHPFISVRSREG